MDRRQEWFDRGCEAFRRTAPQVAGQIPWERFYVCPLCLTAFSERALTDVVDPQERLTYEHVPPESVGGKRMLLTCGACNSDAGTEIDGHMRLEADTYDFMKGNLREVKAKLQIGSDEVPIRLSVSKDGIRAAGVVKAVKPETHKNVMSHFEKGDHRARLGGLAFQDSVAVVLTSACRYKLVAKRLPRLLRDTGVSLYPPSGARYRPRASQESRVGYAEYLQNPPP